MDIPRIISVDFKDKRRVTLPEVSLNRPGINKVREKFIFSPYYDFLLKQKSLEGIIQILKRANLDIPYNEQRYSYYSGLSKSQWCEILEQEVKKAKHYH